MNPPDESTPAPAVPAPAHANAQEPTPEWVKQCRENILKMLYEYQGFETSQEVAMQIDTYIEAHAPASADGGKKL